MTLSEYITNLDQLYQLGNATEHAFRADLQNLLETLVPDIQATNEPKRIRCGAPDFILTKNEIPVGFIEAKDIGEKDLEGLKKTGNKEQFDRYKAGLSNLIFTDYLDFHFYENKILKARIAIGELRNGKILPKNENFDTFTFLIKNFCVQIGQNISNPQELAAMMAGKAKLLANVIEQSLESDEQSTENSTLKDQFIAFQQILIQDIRFKGFADVYAQTIAYGMFAARLHDPNLQTFSRQKAAELIPKSNPFLRKLFSYIAGVDLDERLRWIVDSLVDIFLACDVEQVLQNYGKQTQTEEPIIHFYETFLAEYDPVLRKSRGVWYTPAPVVKFMVRALDSILKSEFGLEKGLAENVQILDPATGTGTFLAEIIKQIYQRFEKQEGIWTNYVEKYLLPRLNGFELLMASYAMAHLQLDLLLKQTGYKNTNHQRLNIFLTNSLQESHSELERGFANWLSIEANEANRLKRDTPLMCVIGNPPYAVSSSNRGTWIQNLIGDYKKGLNEKKINLDDDYIKFIRLGQYFIDKNGSGVLAYISNNSFLSGLTQRQMRKSLLESFDRIYVLDLHGNARKKETNADGSADSNVFDIMQGVSINIFVKTGKKKTEELGQVFHTDLQGKRQVKFDFLEKNTIKNINWKVLTLEEPHYFFVPKDFSSQEEYDKGFKINELFEKYGSGVQTDRDSLFVDPDPTVLGERIKLLLSGAYNLVFSEHYKVRDSSGYNLLQRIAAVRFEPSRIIPISYRLFDLQSIYYDERLISRAGFDIHRHLLMDNIAVIFPKMCKGQNGFEHGFVTKTVADRALGDAFSGAGTNVFPLYLYPEAPKSKKNLVSETKKQVLEANLKYAEKHFKEIHAFFHKTVLPFYKAIENPRESEKRLFEENRSIYEEAKAACEKLENQLAAINNPQKEIMGFESPQARKPNLNKEIIQKIGIFLGAEFANEKSENRNQFAPIDVLDYVYAVLHSPFYREKYKELLKIDFPKIPYPANFEQFNALRHFGAELRQVHLLESPLLDKLRTSYPLNGNNVVQNLRFEKATKKVYINDNQYFSGVSESVWHFTIGGYQPAQKWLKDRKEQTLRLEEILHYQKIIQALTETERIMGEIDANISF